MLRIILNMLLIITLSTCQRRITNGSIVDRGVDTSFVVYIVSANEADSHPGWMCGGSIVHPSLVLTAAACLMYSANEAKQLYVIAGYRKYVKPQNIDKDRCTQRMKKKIISICTHGSYVTNENAETKITEKEWMDFNIGFARTETPIDFYDSDYLKYCSYRPNLIQTNYVVKFTKRLPDDDVGHDVVVYGWGHAAYYRPDGDLTDYNEEFLKYASSTIVNGDKCMSLIPEYPYIRALQHRQHICTAGKGNLDASGVRMTHSVPTMAKCTSGRRTSNNSDIEGKNLVPCYQGSESNGTNSNDTQSNDTLSNDTHSNDTRPNDTLDAINAAPTRRNGICQNDHGSPLVRWIGGQQYLIGVAASFLVNENMECVGPYLYTSVFCFSKFVSCVIENQKKGKRRSASHCDDPDKGYVTKEIEINW